MKKERYCTNCLQRRYHSGRKTFQIWAAVGWDYKSPLIFVECNGGIRGMTMKDYQEQVLQAYAATQPMDQDYMLVEDGNRAHGTKNKDMRKHKQQLGIKFLDDWPPSSPDFNIIENIWWLLKQRLKSRGVILDVEALKQALQEEWDRLTQDEIQRIIVSMPKRMMEAYEKKGLATKF